MGRSVKLEIIYTTGKINTAVLIENKGRHKNLIISTKIYRVLNINKVQNIITILAESPGFLHVQFINNLLK